LRPVIDISSPSGQWTRGEDIKLPNERNSFVDSWKYFHSGPEKLLHNGHFRPLIELTLGDMSRATKPEGRKIKFIVIGNLIKHAAINVD
jgi:hypothetical protein